MSGNVVSCELKVDKEGKSRGMGIVRFEHAMEAVQAICILHLTYCAVEATVAVFSPMQNALIFAALNLMRLV